MICKCDEVREMNPLDPSSELCPIHDLEENLYIDPYDYSQDDEFCQECGSGRHATETCRYFDGVLDTATEYYRVT